jgi:hypothetical protein
MQNRIHRQAGSFRNSESVQGRSEKQIATGSPETDWKNLLSRQESTSVESEFSETRESVRASDESRPIELPHDPVIHKACFGADRIDDSIIQANFNFCSR